MISSISPKIVFDKGLLIEKNIYTCKNLSAHRWSFVCHWSNSRSKLSLFFTWRDVYSNIFSTGLSGVGNFDILNIYQQQRQILFASQIPFLTFLCCNATLLLVLTNEVVSGPRSPPLSGNSFFNQFGIFV